MTRRTNMPGAMGVLGFVCVQVCTHAGHFLWALKSTGGPAGQIGTSWPEGHALWGLVQCRLHARV